MSYVEKMKKNEKTTERVIDMYLKRFPLEPMYGITLASSEDDSEETFYYKLSKKELGIIKEWKDSGDEDEYLQEYLEYKGEDAMIERFLDVDTPFLLDIIKSCDLDNPLTFTHIKVSAISENDKIINHIAGKSVTNDEMKQLLNLFISSSNHISVNQLTYKLPKFTQDMMEQLCWNLCDNVCEYSSPFAADMVEIKEIVENILNPEKDVLGLYSMDDDDIKEFLSLYEIVPKDEQLFSEQGKEDHSFYVYSSFKGHTLQIEKAGGDINMTKWETEQKSYNADELKKALGVKSYQALQDYLKEHFNTSSAMEDIHKWVEENCPQAFIE